MRLALPRLFTLAATVVALVHGVLATSRLPERVASHFGVDGQADGWTSRGTLVGLYLGLVLLMAAFPPALAALVPRLPNELINMPNKDYWLAPERRAETMRRVSDRVYWMFAGTIVFLIWVFESVFRANAGPEPAGLGDGMWWTMGIYMAGVALWTVELLLSFRRPAR